MGAHTLNGCTQIDQYDYHSIYLEKLYGNVLITTQLWKKIEI